MTKIVEDVIIEEQERLNAKYDALRYNMRLLRNHTVSSATREKARASVLVLTQHLYGGIEEPFVR